MLFYFFYRPLSDWDVNILFIVFSQFHICTWSLNKLNNHEYCEKHSSVMTIIMLVLIIVSKANLLEKKDGKPLSHIVFLNLKPIY